MRLLQPFRRRDFAVLWLGQATSLVGDGIFVVAITFQILELRNSPGALSVVMLAGSVGLVACLLAPGIARGLLRWLDRRLERRADRWAMFSLVVLRRRTERS